MNRRPTWNETWMQVADVVAQRSRCTRRQAGAVLVSRDQQVISTGYNGPPRGMDVFGPCSGWCERAQTGGGLSYDDCVAVHAETNALLRADATRLAGGAAYVTSCPCFACAKNLANSGVALVVCRITTEDAQRLPERSLAILVRSGIGVLTQRDDGSLVAWTA